MTLTGIHNYAAIIAERMVSERVQLSSRWLARLTELLTTQANDVFPSSQLLDHIPTLIAEIAGYVRAPAEEEIAANTAVIEKARELGLLRHQQRATVHQLLHEYELLGDVLETFVTEETQMLELSPLPEECFDVLRRLTRAVRILLRTTVDTFINEYTTAIDERNERIRTFNQMASHELRNPIGTLLFAAAALGNDDVRSDPQRYAKIAQTVRTNAEHLSRLIENLQRLAKLGDHVDGLSQQRVELEALTIEVGRQLTESAAAHNVQIRMGNDLPIVHADPARLELVLVNLVSNAIKYSDPDKPESYVEITADYDADRRTCTICVRDNGIGIPEAVRHSIFDRFFRAHPHLDAAHGVSGSGLGLAIAAECVRALGGAIRCESTVGAGTAFFVSVPCEEPRA
jgi:signal transduction histidine kinase